ncbi:hypothetical protein QM450_07385 [Streptococcus infantis]|uniref:hypothetical protein n=1 Tax=Streptococcus infantis TaxID=68892 RepID=UPI0021B6F205
MKVKLFYQQQKQSLQEFESQVNDFMASVEVVDVKYTEATEGDYENLSATLGLLILYKE